MASIAWFGNELCRKLVNTKTINNQININIMTNTSNKPAVKTAATTAAIDIAKLTKDQLAAIVAQHQQNVDTEFADYEAELNGKFHECQDILAKMKEIKTDYKPSWEITEAPQACANDIKKHLKQHGGSASKTDIVAALEATYASEKVEKTLTSRCGGTIPLWTYDEASGAYTIINKTKKNNN